MIQFDQFNLNQDFELFQHQLWFDLQPECYVSLVDTIRIFKNSNTIFIFPIRTYTKIYTMKQNMPLTFQE